LNVVLYSDCMSARQVYAIWGRIASFILGKFDFFVKKRISESDTKENFSFEKEKEEQPE